MAITFKVGFQVDSAELKSGLQGIQQDIKNAFNIKTGMSDEIAKATQQARILESALKKATTDKGVSYYTLNTELAKAGTSAQKLTSTLAAGGSGFVASLNAANSALALSNRNVISLNNRIKEMSRVMVQSFKFSAAQSFLQGVSNAVQDAYYWVKELNTAINDIGVVTGKTAADLEIVTESAIRGAKELRVAAAEYAQGQLIFYQQGLDDKEVQRRTEITVKAAAAANQSMSEMSSQLTAIWNTYQMTADQQAKAASVGAKMAADTAVDFADIAEAMQTAAAPAAQMGVSYNSLAAIIATVGDTTQQSASVIGNAFKTIFSRFQQLKSEGTDGEVTLNRVSSQLQELGVNVLDSSGELRELDEVIWEVGDAWDSWSSKQQLAIAQLVGGTRQYGQFLALMNNYDKYQSLLSSANAEDGSALEQQYTQSLESIESKAENAGEAMKRAFSQLFDEEAIKNAYEMIEGIGNLLEGFLSGLGGLPGVLLLSATILSKKIVPSILAGAKGVQMLWNNATPKRRAATIDREYDAVDANLDEERKNAKKRNDTDAVATIDAQKVKNQYLRETAKINDEINTALSTATGAYKEQLKYNQQLLKESMDRYQKETDNLRVLDQQAQKQQQMLAADKAREEKKINDAQQVVNEYPTLVNDQEELKINAEMRVKQAEKNLKEAMATGDESKVIAATKALAAERANLSKQTIALESMEKKLAQAFEVVGNASSTKATLAYRDSLSKISTEFNKVASSSHKNLTSMKDNVRNAVAALQQMDIPDNFKGELQEIANTVNSPAFTNMKFKGLTELISRMMEVAGAADQANNELRETVILSDQIDAESGRQQAQDRQQQAREGIQQGQGQGQGGNTPPQTYNWGQISSGLTQIGMAAMSVGNIFTSLWSTISDPDLSGFQKAGGIITTVLMGSLTIIPTLISGFQMLSAAGITSLKALGTAIYSTPIIGWIAAAVAGITALIALFVVLADAAYKASPEGKLEAAEEASAELNKQLDETKTKAEEVQSAFDNYNSVVDTLNDCIYGTEEWKAALADVNNQVISLLQDFPELATMMKDGESAITRGENGELQIADWAQEEILKKQNDAVLAAQGAATIGQQNVRQAKINVQRSDLQDSLYGENYASDELGNDASYTAAKLIADNAESLAALKPDELKSALETIFNDNGITTSVDGWVDTIISMGTEFTDLTAAIQANTEAMNLENQNMADQIMADSGYANSEAGSMALEAGGEIYGQLQQEAYKKYMDTDMANFFGVGTEEGKNMWARYAEEMGISDKSGYKVTNYRKDGGVDYEYIDEEGQKQEGHATAEMIASTLAAADAADQLEGSLSDLRNTIAELNASEVESDRAMAEFLSKGNFEGATKGEFDDIRAAAGYSEDATFETNKANAEAYIDKMFDGNLTDEKAKEMGYESADAFITAFTEGLDVDFEVPDALSDSIADKLSLGAAKAIDQTYEKMGKEGEAYMNMLNTVEQGLAGLDIKDQEAAWEEIANIDWTQMDAAERAAEIVEKYGGEIDTATQAWEDNKAAIQDAMNATYDIEAEVEKINAANAIAADLEIGGEISKEDYETLVSYNKELEKYFTILADGSAIMSGDPLDLQQEMLETEQQKYIDMIKNNTERMNEIRDQYNAGSADNLDQYRDTENYVGDDGKNYYQKSGVQTQLDFLASQGYDQEQLNAWQADINDDGTTTVQTLQDIANAVNETGNAFANAATEIDNFEAQNQYLMNSLASTATSYDELEKMFNGGHGDINQKAFDKASMDLQVKDKWEDMDVDEVQKYADYLQEAAEGTEELGNQSEFLSDELKDNQEAAKDVALYIKKMNKGIEELSEGFEDWSDILEKSDEGSEEYMDAMSNMKHSMSDILGVSEDFLSDDFILDNMEDIALAAQGDADAIDRLAIAAGRDILVNLDLQDEGVREEILALHDELATQIPDIKVGATLDDGDFLSKAAQIVESANMTVAEANAYFRSLGFEPKFETKEVPITQELKGTRTYTTNVKVGTKWLNQGGAKVPFNYISSADTRTEEVSMGTKTEMMEVPALTTDGGEPNFTLTRTNAGGMNNYSSSNSGGPSLGGGGSSGGGGSEAKYKPQNAKRDDPIIERYQDITEAINDIQREMDDLADSSDDAFGATRVKQLQKINKLYQDQAKNLQQLQKEAEKYLEEQDKPGISVALADVPRGYGLSRVPTPEVEYNDDGYVSNAEDVLAPIEAKRKALEDAYISLADKYDKAGVPNEALEEQINDAKEALDAWTDYANGVKEAIDQVNETADKIRETFQQRVEEIREWMSNKVEEATYKMELRISINELDIEYAEHLIDTWGDLGVTTGKSWEWLQQNIASNADNLNAVIADSERMWEILNNIDPSKTDPTWFKQKFGEDAWDEYIHNNGALPAEVIEQMQSDASDMISYIDSMYDDAEEMLSMYIDMLDMYMDKFDQAANTLSRQNDRLDMLTDLLEFSGQKYTKEGREAIKEIADTRVDNAQAEVERAAAQLDVAKKAAEDTQQQLNDFYDEYGKDPSQYTESEAFIYNKLKEAADAAEETLNDAESTMTSSIQDLADAAATSIEEMAWVIKQEVIDNLGGDFTDFGDMTTMYDQQYDLDHFFLEDYDKNYQLDKLLGQIDDQMESITDPARMEEYKKLIDEINAANQEGVDITQTDVDLLNAKFELQKAQDAYEEAQNAKNTMRLARDASGNWNYVYSTDESQTEDAAQALADAQYNYDKLLHEARDESSQLWMQAQQEFFEFQETIDRARYESDEKYRAQIDQQMAYYQEKTRLYSEQVIKYNGMLGDDFKDTTLGIITNYGSMEEAQEAYTNQHENYNNQLNENNQHYQEEVDKTCQNVGFDYENLAQTVKDETKSMRDNNDLLRQNIDTLRSEAIQDLDQLNNKIGPWRATFVQNMNMATAAVNELITALQNLQKQQLHESQYTGFNAETDYTAKIQNYVGSQLQNGVTAEELAQDEELFRLVTELKNKLTSEELKDAGHTTVIKNWNQQGPDFVQNYITDIINSVVNALQDGTYKIFDEIDEWVVNNKDKIEGTTASGGLIKTPQIRSLAEEEPELVLNGTDTKNILEAVKYMRETVKMKIQSANFEIDRQTKTVKDPTVTNDIQQVDQQVHIDATFPNVSVAAEIEEAFSNLVNQAVQYASSKNRKS